jgi:hypothetical protein
MQTSPDNEALGVRMKAEIKSRFDANLSRVRNLIETYDALAGSGSGRRDVLKLDVLRSAVVFLHATLEDLLRGIAVWKLPNQGQPVIDKIPLVGLSQISRPETFFLGALVAHKGKTVDALIQESVALHLERSTLNDTNEIAAWLESVDIPAANVNAQFPILQKMMQRRHQIVHRADVNPRAGAGHHQAQSIARSTVNDWVDAVQNFATELLGQV